MLDLERYQVDGQPLPAYTASLKHKNMTRRAKATWNKIAPAGTNRTPAQLDFDVGASLSRQWAFQQAEARCKGDGTLQLAGDGKMDWNRRLTPGICGVRLLVSTLLCWGSEMGQQSAESAEWHKLARDFAEVLNVLAEQAGPYPMPIEDPSTVKTEPGKRVKYVATVFCELCAD